MYFYLEIVSTLCKYLVFAVILNWEFGDSVNYLHTIHIKTETEFKTRDCNWVVTGDLLLSCEFYKNVSLSSACHIQILTPIFHLTLSKKC